jgi:hypothetical protein
MWWWTGTAGTDLSSTHGMTIIWYYISVNLTIKIRRDRPYTSIKVSKVVVLHHLRINSCNCMSPDANQLKGIVS